MPSQRRTISSQASTQGSIQGEEEQRFAELLKPIKDLTANWNVPLSTYLDEYFEEITELQIDIDGQTAKVNFAEAALLLQGTAAVYSRKVEFLWLGVEKMLDILASKKVIDDTSGNATGIGRKAKKGFCFDPSSFSCIDLSLELAKNVDMKPEIVSTPLPKYGSNATNTPEHHQRKMTLKFIFVTPRQLIERGTEGKEMKEIRVNLYVPPSSNSASSTKYDLIGHKEDFRVNMQFALSTAMIGEELSHQSDLGQQSVSLCEDDSILDDSMSVSLFEPNPSSGNTSQYRSQTTDNQVSAPTTSTSASHKDNATSDIATIPPSIDSQSDSNDLDFDSGGYDEVQSDFNNDEDIQSSEKQSEPDNTNKPITDEQTDEVQTRRKSNRCAKEASNTEQMAPLADPWKPITPHEAANTIPKPIRRGRTRRAPTKYVQLSGTKSRPKKTTPNSEMQPIVPVEDFMIQQLSGGKYSLNGLRVGNKDTCMAAELQDRADNVEKMRKRKAALENKQNNNFLEAVEDEAILEIENNQESPEDVDNNWEDLDFEHDPLPDPHEGGIAALVPADIVHQENQLGSTGVGNDVDTSNEVDSYEELVMKRVAAYVAQSQDYIESTDLAKRVAKWHDSIGPRLDAVEKRGNFDIHQYGSRILEYFPDGVAKTTVPFTDIARGKEREEVSRYFLSSLMLANTYNIEISNSTNEPLAMDQVEMTLLSTKRHHENMFQETNVGEPSKSTASPKRKGRKSKSMSSNLNYTSDEEDVPSTSTSRTSNKNIKAKNKKTSKVNGHLNPIAEEQFTAIDDSPVINNQLSESYLEQLDDFNTSSAQASPGIYSNVQLQQNPEIATKGTMDLPSNNKFKVPVSSIDGYKSGRKRKIR